MIITIARECGCDADKVGEALSKTYNMPFYNKKEIIEIAKQKGVYARNPNFFSENPVNSLLYAIAEGEVGESLSKIPLRALQETIGTKDCIVIGRCGNYALKDEKNVFRVFISGDINKRIERIMEKHNISRKEAEELVHKTDEKRANFHKYYTGETWGYAGNYDLCINESIFGVKGTVNLIRECAGSKTEPGV